MLTSVDFENRERFLGMPTAEIVAINEVVSILDLDVSTNMTVSNAHPAAAVGQGMVVVKP